MPANEFDAAYVERKTIPVPECGCLLWLGATVKGGYGKTSRKGRTLIAHRAIWEAKHGPIPEGKILCHSCDVPLCVNVDHLFLGTHQDNAADKVTKNRQAKGRQIYQTVLDEETVRQLRQATGTYASIAREFGLREGNVRLVLRKETWRHVV
jgi:hypothetical protein